MYEELVKRLRKRAVNLKEKFSRNAELLLELTQAADAIEELQRQIDAWVDPERKALIKSLPKWIPVTERLPENSSTVLVCDCFGEVSTAYRHRVIIGGVKYPESWEVFDELEGKITHWMPLPEPPKEENQ